MEIAVLSLFVAAAQAGSFAAVARARGLDPSQVSRSISSLETELGTRLFERTTRQMSLTNAGALYLARVAPLLEELEASGAALRDAAQRPTGRVRLSASVAFGQEKIVPLLGDLQRAYPDLNFDLIFTDANLDLVAEQVDLAVRLAPAPKGDLISRKLCPTRYRLVAAPGLALGGLETPEDLTSLPHLIHAVPGLPRLWRFRSEDKVETQVPVSGRIALSSALAVRACARQGLGIALLADWLVASDVRRGKLITLFPNHAVTATTFDTSAWLLYPSRRYLPLKTRIVIDFLVERLGRTD